jgi:signal transduction histidine kinase
MIPTPIWIENWTAVERFCEEQRAAGVTDIVALLEDDPQRLRSVVASIVVTAVNDATVRFVGAPDQNTLLGRIPTGTTTEVTLQSFLAQIDTVWHRLGRTSLISSGTNLGGDDIDYEIEWTARREAGVLDYSQVVVLLHDIGGRVASERMMTGHIKQLLQLLDMGRGMSATFDTDIILQLLVVTALDLINSDKSLILLVEDEAVTTVIREGAIDDEPNFTYQMVMEGLSGEVIRTRRGVLCDDVATDPRNTGSAREHATHAPGTAVAVAPIISDQGILGTLTAVNGPDKPRFTEFDLSVLEALAAQAAVAMRNAEFMEELRTSRDSLHEAHERLKATQTQLLAAQKMEAIGSLAAGIAHEINTPIQFVSHNTTFVRDGIGSLAKVAKAQSEFIQSLENDPVHGQAVEALRKQWIKHDSDFLLEEIPFALDETLEGAERVAEIVRAMKEFAHPGSAAKETMDVNHVVTATSAISKNEWKYVADLEMDLDEDLPAIQGFSGPLGQSLLILLVNSAQAIAERGKTSSTKGEIKITTSHTDEYAQITVTDNGPGIPTEIADRVFDPFFTTKGVGKGSGQGLSIAHNVIVEKHGGEMWFEDASPGTRFVIRLPLAPTD